jgi:HPt (histidine-containing phosphotransfer) domain-containing protein
MLTIYDHAGSLRRMGNDHELFREMVGLLRSDAPHLLDALRAALKEGDTPRLHRAAHTLKGLAANFGAERAVAAAAEVERLAKANQSTGMPAAITELEESLDELIAALVPMQISRSRCDTAVSSNPARP